MTTARDDEVARRDATAELRQAHDLLAGLYAERLAGLLDQMPLERGILAAFCDLVRAAATGRAVETPTVGDLGCGTGRLAAYVMSHGIAVRGLDLSPEMVRVARREQPGLDVQVGDVRALPFEDGELDGAICWYSLMYLPPQDRPGAFAELARVVRPGGYVTTAWKVGDDSARRGGVSLGLGIGFDIWWMSQDELTGRFEEAGFEVAFWGGRPADPDEQQPQGYLIVRRSVHQRSIAERRD